MDIRKLIRKEVLKLKAYEVAEVPARIRLDANENPFSLPAELKDTVLKEVERILLNRYPDGGSYDLRQIISSQLGVTMDEVMIGNGSDELIQMIVTAFGSLSAKALYPVPTFSMYGIIAKAQGNSVSEILLDDDFDLDVDKIISAIKKEKPMLVFISYPNNPTGNCFSEDRIKRIIEKAKLPVIVDEAYYDFSRKTFLPYLKKYKNLIILRSLSKIGLAGLRVGILIADKGIVKELNKVRLPYNLNSYSQAIASAVLKNRKAIDGQVDNIISERKRLMDEMKKIDRLIVYPSDSNFILFRANNADKIFKDLIDKGILIRNMNKPGRLRNCLRVTIGTPEENSEFLRGLKELV